MLFQDSKQKISINRKLRLKMLQLRAGEGFTSSPLLTDMEVSRI